MRIAKPAGSIRIDAGPRAMRHACRDHDCFDCNENVICMRGPRKWRVIGQDVGRRAAAERRDGADGAQSEALQPRRMPISTPDMASAAIESTWRMAQQDNGEP
ncbi:hypothetical protein B0G69_4459 [Paraburkholderia sp. RAU2J]|nr:hypothetical protein B0G69_4459 [Paraburkholderia sp. RAU2J]